MTIQITKIKQQFYIYLLYFPKTFISTIYMYTIYYTFYKLCDLQKLYMLSYLVNNTHYLKRISLTNFQ